MRSRAAVADRTVPVEAAPNGLAPPRKRTARLPASIYLAVVLALVTAVGILVLTKGTVGVQVAVAARPLIPGEPVRQGDFRYTDVSASSGLLTNLLKPADVAKLDGRPAVRAVPAGGLVTRADFGDTGQTPQPRAMSVPIDPTHAVGGSLARGDTVDVVDASGVQAVYVVVNARVLSAGDTSGSKLGSVSSHYAVTIVVDEAAALRVAAAITAGKVDIVRATGAPAAVVTPPTTPTTAARR